MKKLTTEDFINKARIIHGDKYDYSKVNYINAKTKVCIICPEHGEFWQEASSHLSNHGCPKCSGFEVLNTVDFINKARIVHGDKYDYSKVEYVRNNIKVKLICPEHGLFLKSPNNFLGGQGCPYCSKYKSNKEFIEESKIIHGDKYDYSEVKYINNYTKVCIICPKHGRFYQSPNLHLRGCGCPGCKESKGERKIRNYLVRRNINYIQNKECLIFLEGLRPDFYLPDYNLIIEYDGEQHFKPVQFGNMTASEADTRFKYTLLKDAQKEKLCEENKVKLLRIRYSQYDFIEDILDREIL